MTRMRSFNEARESILCLRIRTHTHPERVNPGPKCQSELKSNYQFLRRWPSRLLLFISLFIGLTTISCDNDALDANSNIMTRTDMSPLTIGEARCYFETYSNLVYEHNYEFAMSIIELNWEDARVWNDVTVMVPAFYFVPNTDVGYTILCVRRLASQELEAFFYSVIPHMPLTWNYTQNKLDFFDGRLVIYHMESGYDGQIEYENGEPTYVDDLENVYVVRHNRDLVGPIHEAGASAGGSHGQASNEGGCDGLLKCNAPCPNNYEIAYCCHSRKPCPEEEEIIIAVTNIPGRAGWLDNQRPPDNVSGGGGSGNGVGDQSGPWDLKDIEGIYDLLNILNVDPTMPPVAPSCVVAASRFIRNYDLGISSDDLSNLLGGLPLNCSNQQYYSGTLIESMFESLGLPEHLREIVENDLPLNEKGCKSHGFSFAR